MILLLLLFLLSPSTSGYCIPAHSSALLLLKQSFTFTHNSHSNLTSWDPTTDCCSWEAILCHNKSIVTSLDLSNLAISGKVDDSLFSLSSLTYLNLAYNQFQPTQFPELFQLLTNLTYLNLSNAGFVGQVPTGIGGLRKLVSLDLSTFYLDEEPDTSIKLRDPDITTLLQRLGGLAELYLDGVNVSGNGIQWGRAVAGSVKGIRELSLVGCSLSGPIDDSLSGLRGLRLLRLDQNRLDCELPDFVGNFSGLRELSLSNCGLEGVIPEGIFKIGGLTVLDVSNNPSLSGVLPEFAVSSALESLVLSGTNLSGNLPVSIGGLKSLARLELTNCGFSGQLPETIGNLTQLVYLNLGSNNFSGEIPSGLNWAEIVEVVLTNNSFNGSIPVSLGNPRFRNFTKLDLQNNLLSGSIAVSLFSLPSLQELQLSYNKLSGQLQEFVNAAPLLNTVDLSNNNLQGQIPKSLFKLTGLKILELSSNNFSGVIELSKFASLHNLSSLNLSNNRLSVQGGDTSESSLSFPRLGTLKLASCNLTKLPVLLRNQNKLSNLDLSNNRINGVIPNWIWGIGISNLLNLSCNLFTNIERPLPELSILDNPIILDLHSNKLQGPIPLPPTYTIVLDYSNNNLTSVIPPNISLYLNFTIFFSLSKNSLTGIIPPSICNASYLNVLDLGINKLSGSIPQCLTGKLRVLNLRDNQLTGTIPNTSLKGCALENFNLNGNQFLGKLPLTLAQCTKLEVLDLGNNHFHDTFPVWLSNLPQLQVLVLSSNQFNGAIGSPEFPMLRIFDISSNNFTGNLSSKCFASFKSMRGGRSPLSTTPRPELGFKYLNDGFKFYEVAVTVTYKGQEMTLVKSLTVFTYIDLSDNKFQYEIPQVIGELTWLYMLNMSHNMLTGRIPDSLGWLVELESLDLSSNRLSGVIPPELANLTFLSVLNLSANELVGMIPKGGQLSTFAASSFEGNEGLCGVPLKTLCARASAHDELRKDVVRQPNWEFVVVGVGFGAGLAAVFGWLRVYEEGKKAFEENVDRAMWAVTELVGWWREGRRISAEEVVDRGGGRYCVFCTTLKMRGGIVVVQHENCVCPKLG